VQNNPTTDNYSLVKLLTLLTANTTHRPTDQPTSGHRQLMV